MNNRALFAVSLALSATPAFGQSFIQQMKIISQDGTAGDEFGGAVDTDQGVIVVGACHDDDAGNDSGSVYLFNAETGAQLFKLLPDDGAAEDLFGFSVAIRGDLVAIGAPLDDENGEDSGSVYIFDAVTGVQLAKLTPNDGVMGDQFGTSVALDGGIVTAGAIGDDENGDMSGSAYLFDATNGIQLEKLLPDEGAPNQAFGISVAMDGGMVAVGSRSYFVLGEGFTLAAVRLYDAGSGAHLRTLTASNGVWTDMFAAAIDLEGGLLAVGAWARSIFFDHSGAAYIFDASTGEELHYIVPADGHDRDHFGVSVSIEGGIVAIGAHQDGDAGFNAGSAYVYDADSGELIEKLVAGDGAQFDLFGSSVAIDGGVIAIGAVGEEDNGPDSGALYVFGQGSGLCAGDCDGSDSVDFNDLVSMLFEFGPVGANTACDTDDSGAVDFNDLVSALFLFDPCG